MNPGAKNIIYKSSYNFTVTFTNGEVKKFDLHPYLNYPVYEDLNLIVARPGLIMAPWCGMKKLILILIVYAWKARTVFKF